MKRLKGIFEPKLQVYFNDKETSLILNGCDIQAYPSNHLDSFRALTSPKFILLDECDFFRESEQEDVRHVSERYIGKSDPHLVMVSTPNKPEGLFQKIEKEPENSCIYRRLSLGYQVGLDKIFTRGEIEKAKASPSFEREYNLKYLGKIGNVFTPQLIDIVVQNGEKYKNLPVNQYSLHSLGIDGGFGSSNTALVLCELLKDQHCIRVIYSREYEKGNPSFIADRVYELYQKYNNLWIWIDGSNRAFVNELKVRFDEDPNYEKAEDVSMDSNRVIPVNFNTDHKSMLSHLYNIVNKQYLAIPELYDRLIISLRTATAKELTLDKDDSSYNDSFDAIRLACKGFQISSSYGLGY